MLNVPNQSSLDRGVGGTGSESELGKQLQQVFYEVSRTGQLVEALHHRLDTVLRPDTPVNKDPNMNGQLVAGLSPLADSLRTKGMELLNTNNHLESLLHRLAL